MRTGAGAAGAPAVPAVAAERARDLPALDDAVTRCRACPRLVTWREAVAETKRAAFREQAYWGRPVPGFGPADARIAVVGLAPAAHGANRTGRVFTGDRSGDWLYAALHRAGQANQPTSRSIDDGLELSNTRVLAALRCAPPANRPTPQERATCRPYLSAELRLLAPTLRVVLALGAFAWDAVLVELAQVQGVPALRPRPRFGHGEEREIGELMLVGCYHPSQQNTFTGRLTEPMLDAVVGRAVELAEIGVH